MKRKNTHSKIPLLRAEYYHADRFDFVQCCMQYVAHGQATPTLDLESYFQIIKKGADLDLLHLEIQSDAGHVVEGALAQVEPVQLVGGGVLIAHSAHISTGGDLLARKEQRELIRPGTKISTKSKR
jgi:hypothetical protein